LRGRALMKLSHVLIGAGVIWVIYLYIHGHNFLFATPAGQKAPVDPALFGINTPSGYIAIGQAPAAKV